MVARYHHVQIVKIELQGGWLGEELMYIVTLSEPIINGSFKHDYLHVHARDELDAWKRIRDYLDGKRG